MQIKTVELEFKKNEEGIGIIDITRPVEHSVIDSQMDSGIATIQSMNSNVCITTMELEPGTEQDIKKAFGRLSPDVRRRGDSVPERQDVRSSIVGSGITLPFRENRIIIGKWQEIVMIDFDGVNNRKKVVVQIVGE
jgi:secondary thiamine-phosphate synthase enzyme